MRNKKRKNHDISQNVPIQHEPIRIKVVVFILCVTVSLIIVFVKEKRMLSKPCHFGKMNWKNEVCRFTCPDNLKISQVLEA